MIKLLIGTGILLIIASVIMAGCGNDKGTSSVEPERISLNEFKALFDSKADIVIVDTRSLENYEAGHIPGAISVPFPDEIRARHQELPQDKTIVLYCS